ncbi:MAG TPA: 50S ribosomal protein L3 [Planctomycetota bacterium]|nr:50S ribosomal protein L3 [Planctomycetota bacterium]
MTLILGRKRGMTQLYGEDGTLTGVTVVAAGPCVVCQVRTREKDGYDAIQLGFEDLPDRRVKKPQIGQFKSIGVAPKRFLREERLAAAASVAVGDVITAEVFKPGDEVDVIGTTKGRGFAGTIKRHGFHRGPETHGCMNVRQPGSIASRRIGKLPKGKRMAGHMGVARHTTKNLRVVRVDAERGLLFIAGAVPGPNDGLVQVQAARTPHRTAEERRAQGAAR